MQSHYLRFTSLNVDCLQESPQTFPSCLKSGCPFEGKLKLVSNKQRSVVRKYDVSERKRDSIDLNSESFLFTCESWKSRNGGIFHHIGYI